MTPEEAITDALHKEARITVSADLRRESILARVALRGLADAGYRVVRAPDEDEAAGRLADAVRETKEWERR